MTLATLDTSDKRSLDAHVCIVGAGPAGITLASELDGCGRKILLLEAGGLKSDSSLVDYYRGAANTPHSDPTEFRRAAFGGTTGIWGGRCVAFDPIDLEPRQEFSIDGWPISYHELAQYYPKAMQYCDAGAFDFQVATSLSRAAPTIEGFDGNGPDGQPVVMSDFIERYSLPTDFGRRYRRRIQASENVTALLGARCLRLLKAAGADRIEAIEVVDRAGQKGIVRADIFVLATGGIEVPRLLMVSDPLGTGLGNHSDCLGRYYMCHFENNYGRLVPLGSRVTFNFERTMDGVYCRRQLRFTADALRRHRLLNMAFRLHFPSYSDATHGSSVMSGIYLGKSMLIPEYRSILEANSEVPASSTAAHLRNVLTGLPQLIRFTGDWLFRIQLAQRKLPYTLVPNADGTYPLEFNSEQMPHHLNRVTLADEADGHGMRRVRIAWRITDDDLDAACRALLLLRDTLNFSQMCRLDLDEQRLRERLGRSLPLGGHHIGTARMAATERRGVVDSNCSVFGLPNLYIASSAVFPTSSHANPTLTIVALAIRIAKHLRSKLSEAPGISASTIESMAKIA